MQLMGFILFEGQANKGRYFSNGLDQVPKKIAFFIFTIFRFRVRIRNQILEKYLEATPAVNHIHRIYKGYIHALYLSLAESKIESKGYAMIMYYFLSLDKPEFNQFAKELSSKTTIDDCYAMAWCFHMGNVYTSPTVNEIMTFLREHCNRNKWDMNEWLKTQTKGFIE